MSKPDEKPIAGLKKLKGALTEYDVLQKEMEGLENALARAAEIDDHGRAQTWSVLDAPFSGMPYIGLSLVDVEPFIRRALQERKERLELLLSVLAETETKLEKLTGGSDA